MKSYALDASFILAVLLSCSLPTSAEEWASLGGRPAAEIDLASISKKGGLVQVRVRFFADVREGRLFMTHVVEVDCIGSRARLADGWITSDYSLRVALMPDLLEHQRVIRFSRTQ